MDPANRRVRPTGVPEDPPGQLPGERRVYETLLPDVLAADRLCRVSVVAQDLAARRDALAAVLCCRSASTSIRGGRVTDLILTPRWGARRRG